MVPWRAASIRRANCSQQVSIQSGSSSMKAARTWARVASLAELAETLLRELLDRGRALLWVSHDQRIARRIGARVLRLENRRLSAAEALHGDD